MMDKTARLRYQGMKQTTRRAESIRGSDASFRTVMYRNESNTNRLLIQIHGDGSYYEPMRRMFFFNAESHADLTRILRDLELMEDFNSRTIISCELCGSCIIGAGDFYSLMNKALFLLGRNSHFLSTYPDLGMLCSDVSILCSHLIGAGSPADGVSGPCPPLGLRDIDAGEEGFPYVFAYDEVGILLNPACYCSSIIAQER